MNLRIFGIGTANAIAGAQTEGVVTDVKTCWWLKVNTKPVRTHRMDGQRHSVNSHVISTEPKASGEIRSCGHVLPAGSYKTEYEQ